MLQQTRRFLSSLLPPLPPREDSFSFPTYFSLGIKDGSRRQSPCPGIDDIISEGFSLSAQGYNAYFALASFADGAAGRRQVNARTLKAFWVDLDVGKQGISYPTIQFAAFCLNRFVRETGLNPSWIIHSGKGLHVYWALSEPVPVAWWRRVALMLEKECAAFDLWADPACTKDPARVLRLPGTIHQGTGNTVSVVKETGWVWEPHKFVEVMLTSMAEKHPDAIIKLKAELKPTVPQNIAQTPQPVVLTGNALFSDGMGFTSSAPVAKSEPIVRGCRQMLFSGKGQEPHWYAAMSVFKRCVDGREWAHAVSALDKERYNPADCDAKFDHAPDDAPARCDRFNSLNPGVCPACPHWGKITSPVQLWRKSQNAGETFVKQPVAQPVQQPMAQPVPQPVQQPMAQPAPQQVQQPMAQPVQQPVQQRLVIPEVFDHPRVGFRSKRYSVDDRGCIWHKSEKQDDGSWVTTDHILTTSQVYYIKSEWTYTNGVSERSHWFEVRHKHGAVELMRLPASTLASNQSLMAALNSSNILSCNLDMYTPKIFASFMNSYLRSVLENGYSTEIQTRDVFGWTDITDPVTNQPTLGFGVGHGVITDTGIHDMVYKGSAEKLAKKELSIKGDLDKWKYVPQMYRVLNQPAAQLAMCLSFAAPLMHYGPGVVRSAAYSLWSTTSGKGKSQVLCSAASIWGHPEEQFVQRNSSAVMRMRKMAVLNNLPVYMDELSDMKDEDLYALAYSLMGNQEKQKLKSNGAEMVDTGSWSTVTFITSNKCIKEAVARHAGDSEASIVRVMEYECDFPSYADKPEVQEYIHACMDACKTNYGLAGPEFIYQVLKHRDRLATLTQQVETWCRKYGFDNSERFLSYPLAMAMKAGRWAVEYGLLDYDMDALENWVINVFVPHNRRSTEANTSDPVHMLTTYLMERQLNMLVVRANHRDKTMPEQPHGVPDKYIVSLPNNRDITMRAVLATQELYISRSDLHKWLKAQKHSPSNLWKRLEDRGITAKDTTKNFGENIGWMQLPNTRCYRLDATSVKRLGFDIKDAPALEATANVKVL
jgi:hypothetical protein